MSYIDRSSTFFIPGRKGLTPADQNSFAERFPRFVNREGGLFYHNGFTTTYHITRAKHEKAVIAMLAGYSLQEAVGKEEKRQLNEAGYSTIEMGFIETAGRKHFMPLQEMLCREFLTNPESPVHRLLRPGLPYYLAAHSTSGVIALKLLHEEKTRGFLKNTFTGAAYLAPFFDVPYASREHSLSIAGKRPIHALWEHYTSRNPDARIEDLLVSRAYLRLKSLINPSKRTAEKQEELEEEGDTNISKPTCRQIREIQAYTKRVIDNFSPEHASALPSVVVTSVSDPFTCYKTTQHIATRMMNADFKLAQGSAHSPLKGQPELLEYFIRRADACIASRQTAPEENAQLTNSAYAPSGEQLFSGWDELSYRFSLALQRGAGSLNTATGLLQRLGRSRVGNPEMRRQAEGDSLHTSHAL